MQQGTGVLGADSAVGPATAGAGTAEADCGPWGRELPAWGRFLAGPVAVPAWVALLLIEPATRAGDVDPAGAGPALLIAIGSVCAGAMLSVRRRGGRRTASALLAAQAVLTVVALAVEPSWGLLATLLAVAIAAVVPRQAPAAVVAVAAGSGAVVSAAGRPGDVTAVVVTALLAGLGTYSLSRLFVIIGELDRTRRALAEAAVERERLRFARDLHDLLGHSLSLIVVKAEAARRLAPTRPEVAATHAADIEQVGREALTEVRRAVAGYRGVGLAGELRRAEATLRAAGVEADLPEDVDLPADVDAVLGWVVREGVTNVVRHAGARHCRIRVYEEGDRVHLEVVDDGGGPRSGRGPESAEGDGVPVDVDGDGRRDERGAGIAGLAERVAAAGGRLAAERAGTGFRLAVEVPVGRPAAAGLRS